MIKVETLSTHEILRPDGAENDDITPNSLITKNANTAACIETGIGLRYLIVQAGLLDLGDENMVGLAGDVHSFPSNVA
jgi:hypothetical protein